MTEDFQVQQRPSAVPYVLGGGAVGGAAGALAAGVGNVGFKTQAYSSWEDVVADNTKKDEFIKKMVDKNNDESANWKVLKEQAEAVANARKEVKIPEGLDGAKEQLETLAAKNNAAKEKYNEILKKFADGEIIEGVDKDGNVLKDIVERIKDQTKENKIEVSADKLKELQNDKGEWIAEKLDAYAKETAEYKTGVKEAFGKMADADKKALVEGHGDYAEVKKALADAEKALTDKITELKKELTADAKKAYLEKAEALAAKMKDAESKLSKEVLEKCKKANKWYTGLAAAAVGILVGLLARPKAKEV